MPAILQGKVALLDSEKLMSAHGDGRTGLTRAAQRLHLVPALHVDCDDDIDVRDAAAMAHRAEVRPAMITNSCMSMHVHLHIVGRVAGQIIAILLCDRMLDVWCEEL